MIGQTNKKTNKQTNRDYNFIYIYIDIYLDIYTCVGNVSPVPPDSPTIPDKFTMRSSQVVNLSKKGKFRFLAC